MSPGRFVVDRSLEPLARRLRLLGFDVVTVPGARLEALFESARRDGRTVLTTSARHPGRWASVPAVTVAREDPDGAVRAIASLWAPSGPPFGRCSICNLPLGDGAGPDPARVPARVRTSGVPLRHCAGCGRVYWSGSHVDRLRRRLAAATGRPVPGPRGT